MGPEPPSDPTHGRRTTEAREPVAPSALVPGDAVRVRKLRPDGSERFAWSGVALRADRSGVVVRAAFARPQLELGYTTFRTGDVFVEFYRWDRWYAVAQLFAADGALKGWYCDVCAPPRWDAPGELSYVDLALDLWCGADGAITLLDEREFAEYRAAGVFTPAQVEGAERGWAELRALAGRGRLPRWP